jgi:CAAX protease family protein
MQINRAGSPMSTFTIDPSFAGEPDIAPAPPALSRPWGFWSTLGWIVAATVLGVAAAVAPGMAWPNSFGHGLPLVESLYELVYAPVTIVVLVLAMRIARWPAHQYLALMRPRARDVVFGLACVAAFGVAEIALIEVFGIGLADNELDIAEYRAALSKGTLPTVWLGAVLVGPLVEEIVFRGFLYRGWSRSRLGIAGAIVLSSLLFGLLHFHYSWVGISVCVCAGLLLGWMRWRSGTLLVPILLHSVGNLICLVHTAISVHGG